MSTPNYEIDEKNNAELKAVEADRKTELTKAENRATLDAARSDAAYDKAITGYDAEYKRQEKALNDQLDFTIEKIETARDRTTKDYLKEQSGAYTDWQKQSNQYGVNAEQKAAQGMTNTGYSESSQVSMYNGYQNRVAIARESHQRAMVDFDMAIKDAQIQNSVALAEIGFQIYQQKAALAIQKVTANQSVWDNFYTRQNAINTRYDNKYTDVLNQINTENALKEKAREFEAQMAEEKRQFDILHPQTSVKISSSGGSGGGSSGGSRKSGSSSSSSSAKISKGQANSIKKKEAKTGYKKSSEPTVDMNSVLALGFGPISESKLNSLVESGVVQEYTSGNKIKFKLSANSLKQKQLFSRLG